MSECFVYVIAIEEQDLCKVGISNNPRSRLAQLMTGSPFKMSLVQCFEAPDREIALCLEQAFHEVMSQHRSSGEWFRISPRMAVENMAVNYYWMLRGRVGLSQSESVAILQELGVPFDLSCWVANEAEPIAPASDGGVLQ